MSTDDQTGGQVPPPGSEDDTIDAGTSAAADQAEPTPGSDNDGAEAGYTPPSGTSGSAGS